MLYWDVAEEKNDDGDGVVVILGVALVVLAGCLLLLRSLLLLLLLIPWLPRKRLFKAWCFHISGIHKLMPSPPLILQGDTGTNVE